MSDTALNKFVGYGTDAERLAFTPNPAALAAAPKPLYLWWTSDTSKLWGYDTVWHDLSAATQATKIRVATTANITIATALNNADTLDGVALVTGDLVLVKDQSAPAENGIYVVGVSPSRSGDYDTYNEFPGALFSIEEGSVNADKLYLCTSDLGGTINVTALTFSNAPKLLGTNITGLPISSGVSGLGANVATALAIAIASAGAVVLFNGAGGTPSSLALANATGLPLTTGVTGVLPKANGGSIVVQVVNTQSGAVATGTTVIPVDDTIPQITEGDEFMTLTITPSSATNKLRIDVVINLSNSGNNNWASAALFQDATANALCAGNNFNPVATSNTPITFTYYMTAGTTSATTFRVRGGGNVASTTTFNGGGGARRFGGVLISSITITEIQP